MFLENPRARPNDSTGQVMHESLAGSLVFGSLIQMQLAGAPRGRESYTQGLQRLQKRRPISDTNMNHWPAAFFFCSLIQIEIELEGAPRE